MADESKGLTRRKFLSATVRGAVAAPVVVATLANEAHAAKMPKSAVSYQDSPKNGQRCDGCKFWEGNKSCTKVKGEIAAAGWCGIFQPA